MIELKIQYYGMIAEDVGRSEESFSTKSTNIQSFEKELLAKYPNLTSFTYQIAVNNNLVSSDQILKSNDCIAIMPPFAGG